MMKFIFVFVATPLALSVVNLFHDGIPLVAAAGRSIPSSPPTMGRLWGVTTCSPVLSPSEAPSHTVSGKGDDDHHHKKKKKVKKVAKKHRKRKDMSPRDRYDNINKAGPKHESTTTSSPKQREKAQKSKKKIKKSPMSASNDTPSYEKDLGRNKQQKKRMKQVKESRMLREDPKESSPTPSFSSSTHGPGSKKNRKKKEHATRKVNASVKSTKQKRKHKKTRSAEPQPAKSNRDKKNTMIVPEKDKCSTPRASSTLNRLDKKKRKKKVRKVTGPRMGLSKETLSPVDTIDSDTTSTAAASEPAVVSPKKKQRIKKVKRPKAVCEKLDSDGTDVPIVDGPVPTLPLDSDSKKDTLIASEDSENTSAQQGRESAQANSTLASYVEVAPEVNIHVEVVQHDEEMQSATTPDALESIHKNTVIQTVVGCDANHNAFPEESVSEPVASEEANAAALESMEPVVVVVNDDEQDEAQDEGLAEPLDATKLDTEEKSGTEGESSLRTTRHVDQEKDESSNSSTVFDSATIDAPEVIPIAETGIEGQPAFEALENPDNEEIDTESDDEEESTSEEGDEQEVEAARLSPRNHAKEFEVNPEKAKDDVVNINSTNEAGGSRLLGHQSIHGENELSKQDAIDSGAVSSASRKANQTQSQEDDLKEDDVLSFIGTVLQEDVRAWVDESSGEPGPDATPELEPMADSSTIGGTAPPLKGSNISDFEYGEDEDEKKHVRVAEKTLDQQEESDESDSEDEGGDESIQRRTHFALSLAPATTNGDERTAMGRGGAEEALHKIVQPKTTEDSPGITNDASAEEGVTVVPETSVLEEELSQKDSTDSSPQSPVLALDRYSIECSADDDSDITVSVVTWNLAEESPSEEDASFIRKFRKAKSELVLMSGQECENIKPRRTEGRRSREFRRLAIKMLGKEYVPIALHSLGGIQLGLFARRSFLRDIESVSVADVACGIGNVFHNKGAVAAFLQVRARKPCVNTLSLCNDPAERAKSLRMMFVTAHMAAHVKNSDARDSDFWRISGELEAQVPERFLPLRSINGKSTGSDLFDSMDRVFFCGDLNYRLDLPRELTEHTIYEISKQQSSEHSHSVVVAEKLRLDLLRHDQLIRTMAEHRAFSGFAEGKITFAPSFKFDKDSVEYDTSSKQRIPAWTDRILFKPIATRVLEYASVPDALHSDHRPVFGTFRVGMQGREILQKKRNTSKKPKRRLE
jgi:hypothetical protein